MTSLLTRAKGENAAVAELNRNKSDTGIMKG
jgi:hypothetical protein